MTLNEYLEGLILKAVKPGYWLILKTIWELLFVAGFGPDFVKKGEEMVQNPLKSSFFKKILRGFLAIFVGFWIVFGGFLGLTIVLLLIVLAPLAALWARVMSRIIAKKELAKAREAVEKAGEVAGKYVYRDRKEW